MIWIYVTYIACMLAPLAFACWMVWGIYKTNRHYKRQRERLHYLEAQALNAARRGDHDSALFYYKQILRTPIVDAKGKVICEPVLKD